MTNPIREFIPTAPVQPQAPVIKPSYELKSSILGKVSTPIVIGVGEYKIQVPSAPKSNCKKCLGKGYIGIDNTNKKIFICQKCYPNTILTKK